MAKIHARMGLVVAVNSMLHFYNSYMTILSYTLKVLQIIGTAHVYFNNGLYLVTSEMLGQFSFQNYHKQNLIKIRRKKFQKKTCCNWT